MPKRTTLADMPLIESSRLLSLPAELRAHIFSYIFQDPDFRCKRPLIIWDQVCASVVDWKTPIATAILSTCQTTYHDCISLLYDTNIVTLSLRSDELGDGFLRFHGSCGLIEDCQILRRLRHIELEISYDASDELAVNRTIARVNKLAVVLNDGGKLKTLNLVFFDEGGRNRWQWTGNMKQWNVDILLDAALNFKCGKVIGVSRNRDSRQHMSSETWTKLRSKVGGDCSGAEERFREINYEYWEHRSRQ